MKPEPTGSGLTQTVQLNILRISSIDGLTTIAVHNHLSSDLTMSFEDCESRQSTCELFDRLSTKCYCRLSWPMTLLQDVMKHMDHKFQLMGTEVREGFVAEEKRLSSIEAEIRDLKVDIKDINRRIMGHVKSIKDDLNVHERQIEKIEAVAA